MFFGDIMEAACEVMNPQINTAVSDSAILIGPIVINHPRGAKTLVVIVEPSSVGVINFRASQNTSLGRHFHTATHDASQSSMCCPPESV